MPAGGLPCMCATLRAASRAVTRFYDERMAGSGLHVTQYTLLRVLAEAGPLEQGRLAGVLHADATTLSRAVVPLERQGLLARQDVPGDARRVRWAITPRGTRTLERAAPLWERAQADLRARLARGEWDVLRGLATRVAAEVSSDQ
jgi:DNA-binding MarR family transcriptional regulator